MTMVSFSRRIIRKNNKTKFILESFQESLMNTKKDALHLLDVGGVESLSEATRTIEGLVSIVLNLDSANNEKYYILREENHSLDLNARTYFKAFQEHFYQHFIAVLGVKKDEDETTFPKGKLGHLLLIQELISRVVVRVLCDKPDMRSKLLMHVIDAFFRELGRATRELKDALGLVISGKRVLRPDVNSVKTPSGLYLFIAEYENSKGEMTQGFRYEEASLAEFIFAQRNLKFFHEAIKIAADASAQERTALKERIITALVFFVDPGCRKFPTHLLNVKGLDRTIVGLVSSAFNQLKRPLPSHYAQLLVKSEVTWDEAISFVRHFIQCYLEHDAPISKNKMSYFEMLRYDVAFESFRNAIDQMLRDLSSLKTSVGDLFILSGVLNNQAFKNAIIRYMKKAEYVQSLIPAKLMLNGSIDTEQVNMWSVINKFAWPKIIGKVNIIRNPLVQSRIGSSIVPHLVSLVQVNQRLVDLELLDKSESIINHVDFPQFASNLAASSSTRGVLSDELKAADEGLSIFRQKRASVSAASSTASSVNSKNKRDNAVTLESKSTGLPHEVKEGEVGGDSFKLIYRLQAILNENMLEKGCDIKDASESYRMICNRMGSLNKSNFKESPLCLGLLNQVLNKYTFVAKWTRLGAFFFGTHWAWSNYEIYQLRFFHAHIVLALEALSKPGMEPKNEKDKILFHRMVDTLLASFLKKMVSTLPYHTVAKNLWLELNLNDSFRGWELKNEVLEVVPGKENVYRVVNPVSEAQRLEESKGKVKVVEREQDALQKRRSALQEHVKSNASSKAESGLPSQGLFKANPNTDDTIHELKSPSSCCLM